MEERDQGVLWGSQAWQGARVCQGWRASQDLLGPQGHQGHLGTHYLWPLQPCQEEEGSQECRVHLDLGGLQGLRVAGERQEDEDQKEDGDLPEEMELQEDQEGKGCQGGLVVPESRAKMETRAELTQKTTFGRFVQQCSETVCLS